MVQLILSLLILTAPYHQHQHHDDQHQYHDDSLAGGHGHHGQHHLHGRRQAHPGRAIVALQSVSQRKVPW